MGELRVLFVTDRRDAPFRYRCVHACRQLRRSRAVANIAHVGDPTLAGSLEAYSAIVLFRLPWTDAVGEIVQLARRAGIPLLFDCDDLVFDPTSAPLMPFRTAYGPAEWEALYGQQLRRLARTFEVCDIFIGSTLALAQHAERRGKPAFVHPNVVPDEYVGFRRRTGHAERLLRSDPTVGYFAGSDTHDRDFAVVAGALRRVLAAHSNARLLLGGYVNVGHELRGFESRIVRLPYMSFRVLPWAFAACHVTLAPLTEKNEFTDSKSALKFFEPAVFGVPVAATPVAEMARAIQHGVSGWLCESEDDWVAAVASALDGDTSRRVGDQAERVALARHSPDAVAGQLGSLIAAHAAPARGRAPRATALAIDEPTGQGGTLGRAVSAARDAHDLTLVVRSLRARAEPSPEPDAVDRFVENALELREPFSVGPDGGRVLVLSDIDAAGWMANEQLRKNDLLAGETTAVGGDASWLSPKLDLGGRRYRYLVARLRVTTSSGKARTQFYFSDSGPNDFCEPESASLDVLADGVDRTYVIDLWRERGAKRWRRGVRRLWLRCDPSDGPASVRVLALALLPNRWTSSGAAPPPGAPSHRLPDAVREARRCLKRHLHALAAGELSWFDSAMPAGELRGLVLRHVGNGQALLERIEERKGGGSRCLVRGVGAAYRPAVDVVVPVYNALPQTLRCLRSVLRHARGEARLVIIDDASSDPKVLPALRRFARGKPHVVLLENSRNLGFVATCNRGFEHAGRRDVVLLNSDTRVFRGFLQRLQRAVYADKTTGIACPLSNNATILSVPELGMNNPLPAGMSAANMAALIRRSSHRRRPLIVTPVGFCMYVRREVIDQIGGFDAERFGRGFGEENDFGERAKTAGWAIRAADDVYVWHEGKASFGEHGWQLERENAAILEARQPGYHAAVATFVRDNPLAPVQQELRWHLRRKSYALGPAPLFLLHASPLGERPGGTEHIVRDVIGLLRLPRAVIAYPAPAGLEVAEVYGGELTHASRHVFPLSSPLPRFCHEHAEAEALLGEILDLFCIDRAHLHHVMYWPLGVGNVLRAAGVPYTLAVHDYYAVCPSQNLLDVRTFELCCPNACGDRPRTAACMTALHHELGLQPPSDPAAFAVAHRTSFGRLLQSAEHVQFPSQATRDIVRRVHASALGDNKASVVPHGYVPKAAARREHVRRPGPMRVALVGEIAYASKGARGYLEVMERCRGAPIEWHVFGPTDRFDFERRLRSLEASVVIVRHGAYERDELVGLLRKADIDVGLLLSIWPETFSLTLSELLAAGVPVVASRQGALAERLGGCAYGRLIDGAAEAASQILELAASSQSLEQFQTATTQWSASPAEPWVATQRALDEACRRKSSVRPRTSIRRAQAQRLFETRRSAVEADGPVQTTQPASRHASAWWYALAERLKPWMPESVRAGVRRKLADDGLATIRRFRIPGPGVRLGSGLRLDARYLSTARFTALCDDPHLVLDVDAIEPQSVHAIRFNLWCSHPGNAYAQIYWRHQGDAGFDEQKSVLVPLNAGHADWQEYVVRVTGTNGTSAWNAGDAIVQLRFDPVNFPGLFCLGELALCQERRSPPTSQAPSHESDNRR